MKVHRANPDYEAVVANDELYANVERLLRHDPGQRGLAGYQTPTGLLAAGEYACAVESLAESATHVAIVTGFCIPVEKGWTAETDGPPGALFLARALLELSVEVRLISDDYGRPLLEAGVDIWRLPRETIEIVPFESPDPDDPVRCDNGLCPLTDAWVDDFLSSKFGQNLSHAIAIERCGPSHQTGHCHNMRGQPIDAHTAKTHRLFEIVEKDRPDVVSIGIADGGNEIGVGSLSFRDVLAALGKEEAARIICRIRTTHVVLAGVSNWGGYALGLGVCHARGQMDLAQEWRAEELQRLIETLVSQGGAVDGVTRRREATVDGLTWEEYSSVFRQLRLHFGLP